LRLLLLVSCIPLSFASAPLAKAQALHARISVLSTAPAQVRVEAEFPQPTSLISFRNTYAGVLGLGDRVATPEAVKLNGESVRLEKAAPGEFQTADKFTRVIYEMTLAEPSRPAQMSHISWLDQDHGLLMLADLLPQSAGVFSSTVIELEVPPGWTIASNTTREGRQFSTDDPENAVFLIGAALHEKSEHLTAANFSLITSGKWPFSDKDAVKISSELLEAYSRVTRFALKRNAVLMLVPYPGETGPESWSAETRGNVVVLLLGRNAGRKKVLSRLGIVLSHELFHLWVPNSLNLNGDYDWFIEGFTLYQALRMDLRLGLISFDSYLRTIARVYDAYQVSADRDKLSLIEASERRWTTSSSLVYDKGMLVGFLYDLSVRKLTGCGQSIDDVYRDLFAMVPTGQGNANEIIIKALTSREGLQSLARDYIESAGTIDIDSVISAYGIQLQRGSSGTKLSVRHDPDKEQRKLLNCIGYKK
jgi:predicted metalloprotease with PDZ domain